MTKESALNLAAEFLKNKLAAAEDKMTPEPVAAPEPAAAQAPELPTEELQENIGVDAGMPAPEGDEIDQLLSQLSPEELEQLAAELAGDIQGGGAEEDGQVGALAEAIASHLSEQPAPMKSASLEFVKSAEYIEGFLSRAVEHGASIKQAVDLYDKALQDTVEVLKAAELKGDQHKLDLNNNDKIDSEDLKKLREGEKKEKTSELKGDQHKLDLNNNDKIDSEDLKKLREGKKKSDVDEKTAAYYEGVVERAREYGLSDADTLEFVKAAMVNTKAIGEALSSGYNKSKAFMRGAMKGNKVDGNAQMASAVDKGKATGNFIRKNKKAVGIGAASVAGAATGTLIGAAIKKPKQKTEEATEEQK